MFRKPSIFAESFILFLTHLKVVLVYNLPFVVTLSCSWLILFTSYILIQIKPYFEEFFSQSKKHSQQGLFWWVLHELCGKCTKWPILPTSVLNLWKKHQMPYFDDFIAHFMKMHKMTYFDGFIAHFIETTPNAIFWPHSFAFFVNAQNGLFGRFNVLYCEKYTIWCILAVLLFVLGNTHKRHYFDDFSRHSKTLNPAKRAIPFWWVRTLIWKVDREAHFADF